MLRAASTFLSRLPQRAPPALARPFIASHAPGFFRDVSGRGFCRPFPQSPTFPLTRSSPLPPPPPLQYFLQLHVFARRDKNYAEVEVKDGASVAALQEAVIAKLRLDIAPDSVRLLREVEGEPPVLLDSRKKLADQSVFEGSSVLVEIVEPAAAAAQAPIATALPTPLTFAEERVGGELMMVASLPLTPSVEAPFYLTPLEHYGLMRFLQEPPSIAPQMLMLTGPIKSGKSRIVHDVLPRMLAAQYAAAPTIVCRPVIFRHTFVLGAAEDAAAENLVGRLMECARKEGLTLDKPLTSSLDAIPYVAAELAQGVHRAGGELWLLFDELGAPIVASTPAGASAFTQQLKTMVELCSF